MSDQRLMFAGPGAVCVESFEPPRPGPGQILIKTVVSALSAGTEGLLWKGDWPGGVPWETGSGSSGSVYPVEPGYASVGRIEDLGAGVDVSWRDRLVFCFAGHRSRAVVPADRAVLLPAHLDAEDGVFLAALETALTVVQDGAPVAGETVGVWGMGTVGILAASIASRSFDTLAWDPEEFRRTQARGFGVPAVGVMDDEACDVSLELSGNPQALNQALRATRFSGRVVLGSWYGSRPIAVDLGGAFHRSRIQIVSSQVSTLSPALSGRWTKARRFEAALRLAAELRPSRLITHRFRLDEAPDAYRQACERPGESLQVLFIYG